jgi:integrase
VFLTRSGTPYVNNYISHEDGPEMATTITDCVGVQTWKLLRLAGVARPGLSFYALRHTFETVAGESLDQVAVDFIMGHSRGDMASVYRERISDERLLAVTDHVRAWLFGPGDKGEQNKGRKRPAPR